MSFSDYNSIPALNWSLLREMAVSPLQFAYRRENPVPETAAMVLGRATHTAVLEPDRFPLEYVVFSGARRAGKDWDAFNEANADKTILRMDEYDTCLRIRDAVRGNPDAAELIEDSLTETSIQWMRDDVLCKGRVDILTPTQVVDLKTTRDLGRFESTVARYLYHAQMAWYADGIASPNCCAPLEPMLNAVLRKPLDCYLIAAQSVAPFDVVVYHLPEDVLAAGRRIVDRLFKLYQECTASGEWPGLGADGVRELVLPAWASDVSDDVQLIGYDGQPFEI